MLHHTLSRAGRAATLTLMTIAAACRDDATPTMPGTLLPRPLPTTASTRVRDTVPDGTGVSTLATASTLSRTRYRTEYHNGPVKNGSANVYFIWYGNWGGRLGSPAQTLLGELVATLGNSQYWRIGRLYPDGNGAIPSGGIAYSGAAYDSVYSHGAVLAPTDLDALVTEKILASELPLDLNGIYLILASADVSAPGYATNFCALHRQLSIVGARVPYAFVIDPTRAPTACAPQPVGPNGGGPGIDAMASLMVAELFDSVTDPYFTGYYDRLGLEPGSKCAWTYGTTYTTANGARANVNIGGHDFLFQQLWVPSKNGGACGMHQ